jgi:predicted dehydrogenase
MSQHQLRGVLVGAGFFAGHQAEAWSRLADATLLAVSDPEPGKAAAFARQWGLPRAYTDTADMLKHEACDFVDIATRPESHLELVRLVAAHGRPMICQKPMAPTWQECLEMVETCRQAGVRLLIHENWRWQPWFREIKRLLDTGSLGDPFHVGFAVRAGDGRGAQPYAVQPYFRQMPRLIVYETLVHHLDTLRFLCGEFRQLYCSLQRVNPAIAGEDYAVIHAQFASGASGLIDANRIHGPDPAPQILGTLLIEAEQGALRLDSQGTIWWNRYDSPEQEHACRWPNEGYRGDSVRATQAHLLRALRTGEPAESEGQDYLRTVAAVDACYQSARDNQPVVLQS